MLYASACTKTSPAKRHKKARIACHRTMNRKNKLIIIAAVVTLTVIAALYCLRAKPSLPEKYQQATQTTVEQTKEVRQNAADIRKKQQTNDQEITRRVQEARDTVPDDLDTLIDLANSIISESARGKPCARDSNKNK